MRLVSDLVVVAENLQTRDLAGVVEAHEPRLVGQTLDPVLDGDRPRPRWPTAWIAFVTRFVSACWI